VGGPLMESQCMGGAGAGACQINRGVYSAHFDMVSFTLAARF
jgi:hypothetical protein